MTRTLLVHPGPTFSVADVHDGWLAALQALGGRVESFNLQDRLAFYMNAHLKIDGDPVAYRRWTDDPQQAAGLASQGLKAVCYDYWPDVVIVVSSFYIPPQVLESLRRRGHRLVLLATESPYEDDWQIAQAPWFDHVILNDPTNLEQFRAITPTTYLPHAYDPKRHHPRPVTPELACDFGFVGTGYPSRIRFLERVDWSGLTVKLGGNWADLADDSPLRPFVIHPLAECYPNDQAVELYASAKVSANLYRREANLPHLASGWAMGPREVELAACGTFFIRDARGESDEVLGMLPSFRSDRDFGDLARWWAAHDDARADAVLAARAAVEDRTFEHNAKRLLGLLDL